MSATLKYISCPVSQLDLLEPIGVQTQVDSFKDIEYLPISAIQDGAPITFEIGKDERYTDASEFVIKTVVEIQGENGTALTGKQFTDADTAGTLEKVGVINNLGHSLWEQIVLLINDTKVTESSNNYAYKAMLGTLLTYDDVDEKSVLRLSCFKKDHLIDSNQVMQNKWHTGVANARLVFSGKLNVRLFHNSCSETLNILSVSN